MANDTQITVIGNLTADPELRFTQSGTAVLNGTIASTPRAFDRQSNEWKDQETLFLRFSLWREAAENGAESLTKGTRVIALGKLKSRSYETKEGEKRTSIELEVDEIGPSLKNATAKVTRNERQNAPQGGQRSQGGGNTRPSNSRPAQGQQADPWGQQQQQSYDWGTGNDQEPPY